MIEPCVRITDLTIITVAQPTWPHGSRWDRWETATKIIHYIDAVKGYLYTKAFKPDLFTKYPIKLAYAGRPSSETLIASQVAPGYEGHKDAFGTILNPGDWCADGYMLTPRNAVWPGTIISKL